MSWKKLENAVDDGPGAIFLWAAPRLAFLAGVIVVIGMAASFAGLVALPFSSARGVIERTADPDNVIANYEWFKMRHESIQAIDRKISDASAIVESFKQEAGPRDTWHREDREESSRLASVELGLKQQRADLAAEYNAKSRMTNRSIFKAGDTALPERIEE